MNKKLTYQAPVAENQLLKTVNIFCTSTQGASVEVLTEKYDWEDDLWD